MRAVDSVLCLPLKTLFNEGLPVIVLYSLKFLMYFLSVPYFAEIIDFCTYRKTFCNQSFCTTQYREMWVILHTRVILKQYLASHNENRTFFFFFFFQIFNRTVKGCFVTSPLNCYISIVILFHFRKTFCKPILNFTEI